MYISRPGGHNYLMSNDALTLSPAAADDLAFYLSAFGRTAAHRMLAAKVESAELTARDAAWVTRLVDDLTLDGEMLALLLEQAV